MPVVNFDLIEIDFFVFVLGIKAAGVKIIDEQMFLFLLGFVECPDQRRKQNQIGEHRDDQRCGGEQSKRYCTTKVRESKYDKPCKEHDRGVDNTLSCFQNTICDSEWNVKIV